MDRYFSNSRKIVDQIGDNIDKFLEDENVENYFKNFNKDFSDSIYKSYCKKLGLNYSKDSLNKILNKRKHNIMSEEKRFYCYFEPAMTSGTFFSMIGLGYYMFNYHTEAPFLLSIICFGSL